MRKKRKRGRRKGFSRLTRVQSKRQAVYGHAITHSRRYQKGVGKAKAKREHDFLVRHYLTQHKTPLR
ncbi:hypothetical protein DRO69_01990 [Candidatus Bathyarchaeota archaeon]|nr:MAG: hypothetical protein DRO69_01990 [Candidatus Bathyarchaeota archaeon]